MVNTDEILYGDDFFALRHLKKGETLEKVIEKVDKRINMVGGVLSRIIQKEPRPDKIKIINPFNPYSFNITIFDDTQSTPENFEDYAIKQGCGINNVKEEVKKAVKRYIKDNSDFPKEIILVSFEVKEINPNYYICVD